MPIRSLTSASVAANNEYLLTLLVCPLSKEPLEYDSLKGRMLSITANIAYSMTKQGCINMSVHDAELLGPTELKVNIQKDDFSSI